MVVGCFLRNLPTPPLRGLVRKFRRRVLWTVAFPRMMQSSQPSPDPNLRVLFNDHGIAFIHIPKTAGTSISELLFGYSIKHRTWQETQSLDPDGYEKWFKFAIIREPVDRFLSSYDYLMCGGRNEYDEEFGRIFVARYRDINRFVRKLQNRRFRANVFTYFHFRPQSDYVISDHRRVMVNKLIPFERLSQDLPALFGIDPADIPSLNTTPGERTKRGKLTQTSIETINEIYASDASLYSLSHLEDCDLFGAFVPLAH